MLAKRDRSSWYGPGACYAFVAFTGASPPDLNLQLTGDDEETRQALQKMGSPPRRGNAVRALTDIDDVLAFYSSGRSS